MPSKSDQVLAGHDERAASAPTMFRVRPERDGDGYVLTVSGELDLATHGILSGELKRAEASEAKRILLDLGGLTFMDSTGLAVLVEAHARSATNGIPLRIFPVCGQVREIIKMTGLMEIFNIPD
jgi:anti-sigma B factor antagonist